MNKIIKIMLVDDITSIWSYFRLILKKEPDVEIIVEAENGQIAKDTAKMIKSSPAGKSAIHAIPLEDDGINEDFEDFNN